MINIPVLQIGNEGTEFQQLALKVIDQESVRAYTETWASWLHGFS